MANKFDEILRAFEQSTVSHLVYKDQEFSLELSKDVKTRKEPETLTTVEKVENVEKIAEPKEKEDVLESPANYKEIKSPMLGIAYTRMNPDEEPLVKVGDEIKKGQVMCVIEAMKMFNEVTSEVDGVLKAINFKDEDMVEFDQTLFEVEEHA
ncbi:hypothetical protein D3H64_06325 [Atopobacter sp. AH10]|uniref:acetyl-CoA carboxylase biotin carboxyl carrier protein n=1 Tax=Atopobacter sp. AH10 TaxID=2315861 RepID=UPI000EF1A061|nr:biotin/lipoyl-containing protein [Atopobacter sp. AH10]RLK63050.1 hypothetical protein D3H64_06325 [Atopobacter sp. AH10]